MLRWDLPTDNGGKNISYYNITWSHISVDKPNKDRSLPITDLLPNTKYTLTISANNSVGFGNNTSTNCITLGESKKVILLFNFLIYILVPPRVSKVSVCLDWNVKTVLSINYTVSIINLLHL